MFLNIILLAGYSKFSCTFAAKIHTFDFNRKRGNDFDGGGIGNNQYNVLCMDLHIDN